MIYLSQRDTRWAADRLGGSKLTVGRYGCTTTCISMLSDYFGCFRSPKELAAEESHYTRDGLVLWSNIKFPEMAFTKRLYGEHTAEIQESLKNPNKAVILEVNDRQHWVVALRPTLWGNDYLVLDPWTGKKCYAKGTYKNITGSAHYVAI